jgi:chemotaxis protein MotB
MPHAVTRRSAPAIVAALALLPGCVSEQKYDELQEAYQQLQGRYSADEATI